MRVGPFVYSPGWISTVFTASMLGLLIWLGAWQAERAESKLNLQARYDTAAHDGTLRLDPALGNLQSLQFYSVEATGTFDSTHQFLLDNRTYLGTPGYHVLTPLRLDEETGVLVNRGWVPRGQYREILPDVTAPKGVLDVVGKLFPPPRVFLLGSAGYELEGWPLVVQSVDIGRIENNLGYELVDWLIMMAPDAPGGYTRVWMPYYGIAPQRHQAYAFQWFSLAIALVIIYIVMTVRRAQDAKGDHQ